MFDAHMAYYIHTHPYVGRCMVGPGIRCVERMSSEYKTSAASKSPCVACSTQIGSEFDDYSYCNHHTGMNNSIHHITIVRTAANSRAVQCRHTHSPLQPHRPRPIEAGVQTTVRAEVSSAFADTTDSASSAVPPERPHWPCL